MLALSFQNAYSKNNTPEVFTDPETNFKLVMQKLLDHHMDKKITKEDLYRAATAGMLSSLNSGEETWNKLLSPQEMKELNADLFGKVAGIGVAIKFDEQTGYGLVLKSISGSPADKAGLKTDDQVLSVDGNKFKGKKLMDLVNSIRGDVGKTVELKVLREDKILSLKIKRETILWTPVEMETIDAKTKLLTIGFFNDQTPALVEEKIKEINQNNISKLILDLRDNEGGGFDQALKVAELFLPMNAIIANTKNRDGEIATFRSKKSLLKKDIPIIILINKGTYSGAELLVAAIKENRSAKIVGTATFGKWSAQSVEVLPNNYAVKYTVQEFQSPQGHAYPGSGIKPDFDVTVPTETDIKELRSKYEIPKRLSGDLQLKAAIELIKSI